MKGAAWTVPAIAIAAAAPALAASHTGRSQAGLFVQIVGDTDGVGIAHGGTKMPIYPRTDVSWNDETKTASDSLTFNGEGVFTPGGTLGTGKEASGTGFWLSVPMDAGGNAVKNSQVTLKKGATFALDYQIQLGYAATENRLAEPAIDKDIDGQPRLMQNWPGVSGDTDVNSTASAVRATSSAVPMAYQRESYTYNMDGYDGKQDFPVMNFTVRYTTNKDVTLKAASRKLYTQLLLSAPSYRIFWPNMADMAVRVRPISGTVEETVNRSTDSYSMLNIPGVKATTSVMAFPGTSVPSGFPNWDVPGAVWAS